MSLRVDLNDQSICAGLHAEQHNEVNAAVLGLQVSAYASLSGPGQTQTPGGLTQRGPFYVQSAASVQTNLVVQDSNVELYAGGNTLLELVNGGSNDIDITHTGTGQIQLRQWGSGGISLTAGNSASQDITVSQQGTGGVTIECPGTGNPDTDTGQIYITAPYGVFITGGSGGHGDISLHSPVFAWDGLIASGSGVSVDAGQLYVQNASVYMNSVGGITIQDNTSFYLGAPSIDLVSGSASNQWVSARGGFRTYATGNDGVNINADGAGGLVVQSTGGGPMTVSQGSGASYLLTQSQGDLLFYTPARLGFFATNVTGNKATKQTVSGSRGGNAALASLLAALAAYGLVVDSTS